MSQIENLLFRQYGTHGLKSVAIRGEVIELVVAPWEHLHDELTAIFHKARVIRFQIEEAPPSDVQPPWDIIAVDSKKMEEGLMEYVVHCENLELVFVAESPVIQATL